MSDLITITNCKNCGNQIETYNFCPGCGAKKITNRITFKNLVSEFVDRFFNLDNSFIKTFIHLFTKPEEVIDGYIHGLRKRYVNAFGYFAISITITGFYAFLVKDRMFELMTIALSSIPQEQVEIQKSVLNYTFQYQSLINFLLIPILAAISRLVFLNYKKYNLTEHLVIYLYAYSHIVGFMALFLLPVTFAIDNIFTISLIQYIVYIGYVAYVLKKLYKISLKKILIKTLLFIGIISFLYITIIIIAGVIIGLALNK